MADWDERYRAGQLTGEYTKEAAHFLVTQFASRTSRGRALDVACGTGRHALWLAEQGWEVTAVDASQVALEILNERARQKALQVQVIRADLERHEFSIEAGSYDLIVLCNYLQRDLFPSIRQGVRIGGIVVSILAMLDDNPNLKPMNPAYLLHPGELRGEFAGWNLLYDAESDWTANCTGRKAAQLVAQRISRPPKSRSIRYNENSYE